MKFSRAHAAIAAVACALCLASTAHSADSNAELVSSARLALYPGKPAETKAGKLIYRGGLVLSSTDQRFGGLSDIAISTDGARILAVSDEARWFRARLAYDAQGNLSGLSGGELAPMLDPNGAAIQGKDGDAEGLATTKDGDLDGAVIVSFEREHRVWRYDLSRGFTTRPTNVPIGAWTRAQSPNEGLEGAAFIAPDILLVVSENAWGDRGGIAASLEAFPGTPGRADSRSLSVVRRPPFMVTSVARSPDNDLLILERRFSIAGGVGMEVRRVPLTEVRAGAQLQGEILADLSFQDTSIDNMEGIAARRGPKGETLVYIMSDNNFSALQRTVLMMFEIAR